MQKTKLLTLYVLATLLVCSAISVAAAQDADPPEIPVPSVATTTAPDQPQTSSAEGNQTSPSRGGTDPAPIHEADGKPAYEIPPNAVDASGLEESLVYANMLSGETGSAYTWVLVVVGVVIAVAACGAICVYKRRQTRKADQ